MPFLLDRLFGHLLRAGGFWRLGFLFEVSGGLWPCERGGTWGGRAKGRGHKAMACLFRFHVVGRGGMASGCKIMFRVCLPSERDPGYVVGGSHEKVGGCREVPNGVVIVGRLELAEVA